METFTPSPSKPVRIINEKGEVIRTVNINRKQRRRLGIRNKRAS